MSLNGLDDPKIREAYEAASAELGGWFLLKYASRDEVELFERGNGGVSECRNAVAKFEEPSPLYGFVKYRRRNVVIKYMPEDCSRLIQARAAVHFNAVCERFTPHTTTLEIATAEDLNDTKLSASCSLHAASASSCSSSSSLRRRRLNEIAEEEEEEERERKRQSIVKEEERPASPTDSDKPRSSLSPDPPVVLDPQQINEPNKTDFASTNDLLDFTGADRPASPVASSPITSENAPRFSSQTARSELFSYSSYAYGKPKIKLAPRPSLEVSKRPASSANIRPVAALPAGYRWAKGTRKMGSGDPVHDEIVEIVDSDAQSPQTTALPIPETPPTITDSQLPPRPATSSGASIRSVTPSLITSTKEVKMTPERVRLMKAKMMREKRLKNAEVPKDSTDHESFSPSQENGVLPLRNTDNPPGSQHHNAHATSNGEAIDLPTPVTATSDDTTSEYNPTSPTAASSSEIGDSTKASSLSESTDETIPATKVQEDSQAEMAKAAGLRMSAVIADADAIRLATDNGEKEADDATPTEATDVAKEENDQPKSPLEVPLSKFSSNEQKLPSELSPAPTLKTPELNLPPNSNRRKHSVDPIRTNMTTGGTESFDPLLDEALMEELQSATLQEAKPIIVSKSPITPVFPGSSPPKPAGRLSRTVSTPMRGPVIGSGDVSLSSARSVSAGGAAFLHTITRQESNAGLQSKNSKMGSGISQRIKALEARQTTGPPVEIPRPKTANNAPSSSSTFFSVRKPSVRDTSRPPSAVDGASPLDPTPERSRDVTPDAAGKGERRGRSGSMSSRLTVFEGQHPPRGRPESIQVTARILRDPSQSRAKQPEARKNSIDPAAVELKQSPLQVDVQTSESPEPAQALDYSIVVEDPKVSIQERREHRPTDDGDKTAKRRTSLSLMKGFLKDHATFNKSTDSLAVMSPSPTLKSPNRPPSAHHNGGFARRLSISSRRSMSRDREHSTSPGPLVSPSSAVSDSAPSGEEDKAASDKKSKKRTSFMRRLSSSLGTSRKTLQANISPTVTEEEPAQVAKEAPKPTSTVAYLGDVNVQFPDNLLWKRRSMCVDSQGFLLLSAIQGGAANGKEKTAGTGIKRYHLSDFRTPYVPDVEVQELPNSVVLDLLEGSCLQVACGDRAGQLDVLSALQDAHKAHGSLVQ
ncbi:hypothetical protein F4780DRAFT_773984 [Xylariomycetidae sp. FL0641]|nr:hypothetical protein F4780DRAFT_773984 [Xylariomycetidae sp. FL0641]